MRAGTITVLSWLPLWTCMYALMSRKDRHKCIHCFFGCDSGCSKQLQSSPLLLCQSMYPFSEKSACRIIDKPHSSISEQFFLAVFIWYIDEWVRQVVYFLGLQRYHINVQYYCHIFSTFILCLPLLIFSETSKKIKM